MMLLELLATTNDLIPYSSWNALAILYTLISLANSTGKNSIFCMPLSPCSFLHSRLKQPNLSNYINSLSFCHYYLHKNFHCHRSQTEIRSKRYLLFSIYLSQNIFSYNNRSRPKYGNGKTVKPPFCP